MPRMKLSGFPLAAIAIALLAVFAIRCRSPQAQNQPNRPPPAPRGKSSPAASTRELGGRARRRA
jgi:hypothetical protein